MVNCLYIIWTVHVNQRFNCKRPYSVFWADLSFKILNSGIILTSFTNAKIFSLYHLEIKPGRKVQSVMCLAAATCLTADPGVVSWSRPGPYFRWDWSWNNFYDHSPSFHWFKKGFCQLQANVCAWSTGNLLVQACPRKKVVRWTDLPDMTIAVDWEVKNQTKQKKLGNKETQRTVKVEVNTVY